MMSRPCSLSGSFRELFRSGPVSGLDDGELLDRFAADRDEAAFAALVGLHGPMVLGVCRRLLRDGHDVEDAFQATFLVLVKRAGTIRDPGRLGPWLHGVARRVSMRARAEAARRRSTRSPGRPMDLAGVDPSRAEAEDLLVAIDEEVARLPSRYREAVVLCDVEGRPYAEAARRLGCPLGTLQSRLARGRARLRTRLLRRGVAPMAAAAALSGSARAKVPAALANATAEAAAAGAFTMTAVSLAGPIARRLSLSILPGIAAGLVITSIVIGGGLLAGDRPVASRTQADAAADRPRPGRPPEPDRTLELIVVDRDDRSVLAGASVQVRANRWQARDSAARTDEEGRCTLTLPGGALSMVRVIVAHPSHAPVDLGWEVGEPIPDSYTVAMERGTAIGGLVRDDRGRPVAGAQVRMYSPWVRNRGAREQFPFIDSEFIVGATDEQGRWRSDAVPASAAPGERFYLVTSHPDHVTREQEVTVGALRAFSPVGVLKTGRSVSGRVLSPTGRPVAGALVVVRSRSNRTTLRRVETDRDGRFDTGPVVDPEWREFTMVVRADGFAATAQYLLVPREIAPQVVRLSPRKPLHGRVVDAQGRPVAGAIVLSPLDIDFSGLEWQAETDADGRFVWFEAPASGSYYLKVIKSPFRQIAARLIPGGTDDLTLTLHRPQRIHGNVTDAETGRPIEAFRVVPGWGPHRPGWQVDWHPGEARPFGGGRFEMSGADYDQDMTRSIRIEADGYDPDEFLGYHDSQEDVEHHFRLRRAAMLTGIVRGPDGQPLAGVDVAISASIHKGRLQPGSGQVGTSRTRTGPDGRYALSPQGHRASIIAVHDAGFALRSADELAASTDLTLAPWGRIEGVVKIGREPAPGRTVAGWLVTSPYSAGAYDETVTDEAGRFVLDRVAPGRMILYRRDQTQDRQGWAISGFTVLEVKPGETVRVQVGGNGRPVVGRLAIPEGINLGHFSLGHGALMPVVPEPPTPDDYVELDHDRRAAWWDAYSRTPEGRAYLEDRDRSYAVELRPDGTFRAEDVPTGRYVLKLPFEGLPRSSREGRQAFARAEVIVPEIPGGRSDAPLDVGAVPLSVFPFHEPRVGERAPTIAATAPDGRPLDLAAHRGRFVLLHFWSSRPEAAATIPHLKVTFDAFGRDPRFVMIGLYAGEAPEPMRRYADHRGLTWEQRYIGSGDDPNPFEAAFGVWFPPAAFLIGPDGRILAGDLQGEAIRDAVARALR